jgi:gas vesicle protein
MNTKFADLTSELKHLKGEIKDLFPDDLLSRLLDTVGLEQRRSPVRGVLSGTGIFLAGIIVGGAAALLLAPKSGIEMRSTLEDKIDTLIEKVKNLRGKAEEEIANVKTAASDKIHEKTEQVKKAATTVTGGTGGTGGPSGSFHS